MHGGSTPVCETKLMFLLWVLTDCMHGGSTPVCETNLMFYQNLFHGVYVQRNCIYDSYLLIKGAIVVLLKCTSMSEELHKKRFQLVSV